MLKYTLSAKKWKLYKTLVKIHPVWYIDIAATQAKSLDTFYGKQLRP